MNGIRAKQKDFPTNSSSQEARRRKYSFALTDQPETSLMRCIARGVFFLSIASRTATFAPGRFRRPPTDVKKIETSATVWTSSKIMASAGAAAAEDDEFGDSAFLADFDIDAAVKAAKTNSTTATTTVARNNPDSSSPIIIKRQRVSPGAHQPDGRGLEECLEDYFGHSDFRPGQKRAIQAVLEGRDVAIFWATGAGKSICYQIPALFTKRVSLVVSPLISLMQDQVHKLNGLSSRNIATYLGSGQLDPNEEVKALRGEYSLVYVTPEKLLSQNFLDCASNLDLCLIAVDESHCVSQWGHDFRKDYRRAGEALRRHPKLYQVPIMALTATAIPSIQKDIMSSLQMRNTLVCQQTFYRPNLSITVIPKKTGTAGSNIGALPFAMEPLVRSVSKKPASTIIYAVTKSEVEEIASYLQQRLEKEGSPVRVEPYHAGMTTTQRHETHLNFLTGSTAVVVATIAFGMGIDKPDTRRVVHYGPPRTVEEYYQQIGRAGRDGLPAECIMHASPSDFDRYMSEFYLKDLNAVARKASVDSTRALKAYAMEKESCRWKALLDFFHETPSFGRSCGHCDNCRSKTKYGGDSTRDFGGVSRIILLAVKGLKEPSMSVVAQVLGGKILEEYKYRYGVDRTTLRDELQTRRQALSQKFNTDKCKEFLASLVQKGYISETTKTGQVNGYDRAWTSFAVTEKGSRALQQEQEPISLPVPEWMREAERLQEEKRQRVLKQLEERGVAIEELPKDEVEKGDGDCIRAFSKWQNYVSSIERKGKEELSSQLSELLLLVEEWRANTAIQCRMAPAAVLAEHTMYSIAYTTATLPRGIGVDMTALVAAGVRTREISSLLQILKDWSNRYKTSTEPPEVSMSIGDTPMSLPAGPVTPTHAWRYAVYKPAKKTGVAAWESSYNRFQRGESPQAIAMSPANGRPIQVTTVVSHIIDAFLLGNKADLSRLVVFSTPPTKGEWQKLEEAEAMLGIDVVGDPTTSGLNGDRFLVTDMLRPILGDEVADKPAAERTDEEKQTFSEWCRIVKWYTMLKRTGMSPTFEA